MGMPDLLGDAPPSTLRVAAVAWKLRLARSDGDFFAHLYDFVDDAHKQGANVVVFPELFLLELLPLAPDLEEADVPAFLVQFSDGLEEWLQRISASSGMTLVGGSHFRQTEKGIVNVSATATPDGRLVFNPKNRLTRYEREIWGITPGEGLALLQDPRLGVNICYDSEFPEAGRAVAEAGAKAILVPAFTETRYGFQRVRWACLARATENQVFTVHASLVGELGYQPVPSTYGTSAIIAPSIEPFPESAVLAETELNQEGIAVADLEFDRLFESRQSGDVANWRDRLPSKWNVRP